MKPKDNALWERNKHSPKYDQSSYNCYDDFIRVNCPEESQAKQVKPEKKNPCPKKTELPASLLAKVQASVNQPVQKITEQSKPQIKIPTMVAEKFVLQIEQELNNSVSQTNEQVQCQQGQNFAEFDQLSEIEKKSQCMSMISDLDKMNCTDRYDFNLTVPIYLDIRTRNVVKCRILSIQFKLQCCKRFVNMVRDKRDKINNRFQVEKNEKTKGPCEKCVQFGVQVHVFSVHCPVSGLFQVASCNEDKVKVEKIRFVTCCSNKWKGSRDALLWHHTQVSVSKICQQCQQVQEIDVKVRVGDSKTIVQEDQQTT